MVTVLVGHDIGLGERSAFRAELRLEVIEESEVDVDVLVSGAVEGADRS